MLESIFSQYSDWGLLILRIGTGLVFLAHGWPKLNPKSPMGGPAGFGAALKEIGIPLALLFAWAVTLLETAGAVLLMAGFATRLLAIAFAVDKFVAVTKVKLPNGVKFSEGAVVGWEFDFILLAAALALVFTGPGSLALDFGLGW